MTPREQHLRNECGQLTHKVHAMMRQRAEMQADLIRQRQDMADAIAAIERGEMREAVAVLQAGLAYRDRTREKRKVANGGGIRAITSPPPCRAQG